MADKPLPWRESVFYNLACTMWQKSEQRGRAEYLTRDKLSQEKFGQPQTPEVPRTMSSQAVNLENRHSDSMKTPDGIGFWFWLWVLCGTVTKRSALFFEENKDRFSALCRGPGYHYTLDQPQFWYKWGNMHLADIKHT